MHRAAVVVLAVIVSGCAHVAPSVPRFVTVYEQRTARCRIQVMRDTRSTACFVGFRCGRQPLVVVHADPEVCVP